MKTWWRMVGWRVVWVALVGVLGWSQRVGAEPLDAPQADGAGAGFAWGQDAARSLRRIGPLEQGLLTVEVLTQGGAHDGEYETRVTASWRGPGQGATWQQVLFEGFGFAHANEFEVGLEERALVLRYPTGEGGGRAQARWIWQASPARFERAREGLPEEVRALTVLLDQNRLLEARDALESVTLSARGALLLHEDAVFERLLRATYRAARARYDAGCAAEAAALLVGLIGSPPLLAASLRPPEGDFVVCVGAAQGGACEGGFNHLPADGATAALLNDSAFLLQQGGYAHLAAPLLRQVVTHFPTYAAAHLNLADALWALGEQVESRMHYRWLWELYQGPGPVAALPAYVSSRLEEPAPLIDHTTDAAQDL